MIPPSLAAGRRSARVALDKYTKSVMYSGKHGWPSSALPAFTWTTSKCWERFNLERLFLCVEVLFCVAVCEVEQEAYVKCLEWRSHHILTQLSLCLGQIGLAQLVASGLVPIKRDVLGCCFTGNKFNV